MSRKNAEKKGIVSYFFKIEMLNARESGNFKDKLKSNPFKTHNV
jgi:hypothetical protein